MRTSNYMSNAATLCGNSTTPDGAGRSTVLRGLVISCAALLLLAAGASAWFYAGTNPVPLETKGMADAWAARWIGVRPAGIVVPVGALSLAVGVLALVLLRSRTSLRRQLVAERLKSDSQQQRVAGLQALLAELRQSKEDLVQERSERDKQYETLAAEKARLEEELNKRTRAEKALAQKRQELESSKNVLELHVQARKQELQHLQRRYELILNSAGDGILGLDVGGRATFVNPVVAKLTGWPIADLLGKPAEGILFPVAGNEKEPAVSGRPEEQVFCRRDGTRFPVECVKTPINENGRVVGSVLVFKDITERRRVEETLTQRAAELARSNAELEQFAFVASHDLQEPLRKIQAFGDRLKLKCDSTQAPETRDYLDRMQNAAARMRTLIDDLLAFSRVMRRSEPFVPVDLGRVTREVLGDLEVRIEKSGAKVEVGELPTLDADATQMRQLILNLLSNALKFQPPGGTPVVKISARALSAPSGEPLCEISVQDNGIGFEEKYLDKIFAVFQRLHGRSEYEGTGVGLAVCRRIVDRHHGNITARSQPGQGATFVVTLPVKQVVPAS
jgi:PAS domain S-box-containing protein